MDDIYRILAPYYDEWNAELDYGAWADGMERVFAREFPLGVASVLDLAAGTGRMTVELARRGYDMVGVDLSPEMLNVARERAEEAGVGDRILWLCQDMTSFELYGTVEAVVSCLDSLNHLTGSGELRRCFSLVHNYLVPDGLFLFDMNSAYRFLNEYAGESYTFEAPGVFCVWQNDYRESSHLCDFGITLFREEKDGRYRRFDALETERMYPMRSVLRMLSETGFETIGVYAAPYEGKPEEDTGRWYFVARAKKPGEFPVKGKA